MLLCVRFDVFVVVRLRAIVRARVFLCTLVFSYVCYVCVLAGVSCV